MHPTHGAAKRRPAPLHRNRAQRRGFTLIELVVVMAIIGLLLSLAAPRFVGSLEQGRQNVRRQNIAVLRGAIDQFKGDLGRYPETLDELVTRRYLREVPIDPVTERGDWRIVPPPEPERGVFDVQPPEATVVPK